MKCGFSQCSQTYEFQSNFLELLSSSPAIITSPQFVPSICNHCGRKVYCSPKCRLRDLYMDHLTDCKLLKELSPFKTQKDRKREELEKEIWNEYPLTISDFQRVEVQEKTREFSSVLGKGAYGEVELFQHINNQKLVAIKKIQKSNISKEAFGAFRREIEIQKSLRHSNIIKLYSEFEDADCLYLVLEYASGGNLFQYIRKHISLSEKDAFYFFVQVCAGLSFLHANSYIHRDIKPENLLISDGIIKICDFGWCGSYQVGERETFCGTLEYMAPEMILHETQTPSLDLWSIGVLLYEMLHGYSPFRGASNQVIMKNILGGQIKFRTGLSFQIKSLMQELLMLNAGKRISANKILVHPWAEQIMGKKTLPLPELQKCLLSSYQGAESSLNVGQSRLLLTEKKFESLVVDGSKEESKGEEKKGKLEVINNISVDFRPSLETKSTKGASPRENKSIPMSEESVNNGGPIVCTLYTEHSTTEEEVKGSYEGGNSQDEEDLEQLINAENERLLRYSIIPVQDKLLFSDELMLPAHLQPLPLTTHNSYSSSKAQPKDTQSMGEEKIRLAHTRTENPQIRRKANTHNLPEEEEKNYRIAADSKGRNATLSRQVYGEEYGKLYL